MLILLLIVLAILSFQKNIKRKQNIITRAIRHKNNDKI